jgi:hypothetical protein
MSRNEFINRANAKRGKIFSIKFIKRTTGEVRKMTARMGVTSHLRNGVQPFNQSDHNLVTVFSMRDKGYRNIPIENIIEVKGI